MNKDPLLDPEDYLTAEEIDHDCHNGIEDGCQGCYTKFLNEYYDYDIDEQY